MAKRKTRHTWMLLLGWIVVVALAIGAVALDLRTATLTALIRTAAILGYVTCFLAVLSSIYMKELAQTFGRSFVQIHHIASITALAALVTHAVSVAVSWGTPKVFLPSRTTFQALALWMIVAAAIAAGLRKPIGKRWKYAHWLVYLAFIIGTVHAQLIGATLQHPAVRIVSAAMALAVVVVFVLKRFPRKQLTKPRSGN